MLYNQENKIKFSFYVILLALLSQYSNNRIHFLYNRCTGISKKKFSLLEIKVD